MSHVKRMNLGRSIVVLGLLSVAVAWPVGCAKQKETSSAADLISAGWNNYSLGEFERAVTKFQAAADDKEASPELHQKALFGLATTWSLRRPNEDKDKAKALYQQLIDADPKCDLAIWSALALARMKHLVPVGEDPDYNEVNAAYDDIIQRFPGHLAAKEAFLFRVAILVSTLKREDAKVAVEQLNTFIDTSTNNEFVGPAFSLLAVSYTTLGEQEKRLDTEIRSLDRTEIDPANPFTEFAWQYWNIATIAEFEVGDFDTARTYYKKLIEQYPTDKRIYAAKKALKRMDEMEAKIRSEL